jgi:hypothetical protein
MPAIGLRKLLDAEARSRGAARRENRNPSAVFSASFSAPSRLSVGFFLLLCLPLLHADAALEVHDVFQRAAMALSDWDTARFLTVFDPKMAAFGNLRDGVTALLRTSDVQSTVEFVKNEGDAAARTVVVNWTLAITQKNGGAAHTERKARVECQLRNRNGEWRIVSIDPVGFFDAGRGEEAWQTLMTAAKGLAEGGLSGSATDKMARADNNTFKFMSVFDRSMRNFQQLRQNVLSLEQSGDIESTIDLISNTGDDRARTLQVDWTIQMTSPMTGIAAFQRHETVTCRVEKRGKNWRITSLEPVSFLLAR